MKAFITIIFVLLNSFLFSSECSIYIDGSMSMKGFSQSNALSVFVNQINTTCKDEGLNTSIIKFISDSQNKCDFSETNINNINNPAEFSGRYTLLNRCLDNKNRSCIKVIITDNITTGKDANTTAFYNKLNTNSNIELIDVMPVKLPFNGLNYATRTNHNGEKGLLCYFIFEKTYMADDNIKEKYKKLILSLSKNLNNEILHIKPVNAEYFNIIEQEDQFHFDLNEETKNYNLRYKSNIKPILVSNKPFSISLKFDLKSKYQYIILDKATEVKINNIALKNGIIDLPIKVLKLSISPSVITDPLEYESSQRFNCIIEFIPLINGWAKDLYLVFNRDNLILSFDIELHNKHDKLKLSEGIFNKYFSKDSKDVNKIYTLVDPINYFNNENSFIKLHIENEGNKKIPGSCLSLKSPHDSLVLTLFFAIVLIIITGAYYIYKYLKAKSYIVIINQNEKLIVKSHSFNETDLFKFESKYEGLFLTIKSNDYHYGILAKKQAILRANREYSIESNTQDTINIQIFEEEK